MNNFGTNILARFFRLKPLTASPLNGTDTTAASEINYRSLGAMNGAGSISKVVANDNLDTNRLTADRD